MTLTFSEAAKLVVETISPTYGPSIVTGGGENAEYFEVDSYTVGNEAGMEGRPVALVRKSDATVHLMWPPNPDERPLYRERTRGMKPVAL